MENPKLARQYVKNAKAFFPTIGKEERQYLRSLTASIEDFCEENDITTLEDLYAQYGPPSDIVSNYFSSQDTDSIVKKLRTTTYKKRALTGLIIAAFLAVSVWSIRVYYTFQIFKAEEVIIEQETTIE